MRNDIFSEEKLKQLIKYDKNTLLVDTREGKYIEFKENFNFANKKDYFKAFASFANAKGGYIIFGITDKPRKIKGLSDKSFDSFNNMKLEDFTVDLNSYFSPEIEWETTTYKIGENKLGIIYVYEASLKPVICKKRNSSTDTNATTVEGEIYYRYYARNERIHFDDLMKIIIKEREKESKKWMTLFTKISKTGVDNVGLLDLNNGVLSSNNNSLILDDNLLSKIKFIKEGEFNEKNGTPTLRVFGDVNITQGQVVISPQKVKVRGIRSNDIITDFLNQKEIKAPIDYITQICYETTAFLPLYYYVSISNKNISEIVEILKSENVRSQAKTMLIERISKKKISYEKLRVTNTEKGIACSKIKESILNNTFELIEEKYDCSRIMESIQSLTQKEIVDNKNYILDIMRNYYLKYYQIDNKFAGKFRKAVCWIDEALYMKKA